MSKFKVGDRVVVVSKCWIDGAPRTDDSSNLKVGSVFTIEKVTRDWTKQDIYWDDERSAKHNAESDKTLELESVYNSPLYQALL